MSATPRACQRAEPGHLTRIDRCERTSVTAPHPRAYLHHHGPRPPWISIVSRNNVKLSPATVPPVRFENAQTFLLQQQTGGMFTRSA